MIAQQRRVRTVRLRASDEPLIRRGAILLEDALRVASLPHVEQGRLLVIRSLSLGSIHAGGASTGVALAVERRVQQLAVSAAHAEEPGAAERTAVYFRDDAEPAVLLARTIARQESTDAWFWPLAVPAWRRDMTRDEALRTLLHRVMETRAGPAAAVTMIGDLHEHRVLDVLLSALGEPDGPTLLRAFGWTAPPQTVAREEPAGRHDRVEPLPAEWTHVVERWSARWGADDARSTWLAATALAAEKPGRLADGRLTARAHSLVRQVLAKAGAARPVAGEESAALLRSHPSIIPGASAARPSPHRSHSLPASAPPGPAGDLPALHGAYSGETTPQGEGSARPAEPSLPSQPGRPTVEPADVPTPSPVGPTPGAERAAYASHPAGEPPRGASEAPYGEEPPRRISLPDSPQFTAFAGLYFLLSIMARLGMARLIADTPHLAELNIPDRLLRGVGRRLGIPDDDPVLAPLAGREDDGELPSCAFTAPVSWSGGIYRAHRMDVRRLEGSGGARVLLDASGRLPLALWRGRAPAAVRDLAGDAELRRERPMPHQPDVAVLLDAWLIALNRWSRRYAQLGLHDLVWRPGRIAATRTHLDLLFGLDQVDIRVRKGGLDQDPGWVPWFGRVVTFHYLSEEGQYGEG